MQLVLGSTNKSLPALVDNLSDWKVVKQYETAEGTRVILQVEDVIDARDNLMQRALNTFNWLYFELGSLSVYNSKLQIGYNFRGGKNYGGVRCK